MKLIILAAGQGTRLRPMTDDRPKCLVPLAGKTLLDRQLAAWRACGVTDVAVVTGYRAEMLAGRGVHCCRNEHYERTNMVASLFCADAEMREAADRGQDLLIGYGDVVFEPRIARNLLAASDPIAVLVDSGWRGLWKLRMDDPLRDAETLKLTPDGYIRELGLKPSSYADIEGQYMGLLKVRADAITAMCDAYRRLRCDPNLYMTAFLQHLIDTGWRVRAVPVEHGWLEVDSLDDLHRYEAMWMTGDLRALCDLEWANVHRD
jgi:choline kinase